MNSFFDRIPDVLIKGIGNGCVFGDKAFSQIHQSEPRFFDSVYSYGLRSRIHDKAIQFYLDERLADNAFIQIDKKDVGFGNRVLFISGKDYLITPCHVSQLGVLPCPAKYKKNAATGNPGNELYQLSLFTPPVSKTFTNVYFVLSTYFDGNNTIPKLVMPNNNFTEILDSRPIFSEFMSEEETTYQERIMPKLISEVEKEHEQGNG